MILTAVSHRNWVTDGFFFGTKTCGQISMCQHADPGQMATQLRVDVLKEIGNIFFWFNYNRFPRDSIYCWHVVLDGKMNTIKLACLSLHSPCFHPLTSFLFLLRAFSLSSLCLPFNCCAPIYFPSFICLFIYLYPIFLQLKAMLKAGHNIITCAQHNSPRHPQLQGCSQGNTNSALTTEDTM